MQTLDRCSFLVLGLVSACFSVVVPESTDDGPPIGDDAGRAPLRPTAPRPDAGAPRPDAAGDRDGAEATPSPRPEAPPPEAPAPGPTAPAAPALDVVSAAVTGPTGAPPRKGDPLTVELRVDNPAADTLRARLTALVDSARFSDYVGVPLGSADVLLPPGASSVTITGGPFLSDPGRRAEYALGRGDYTLSARIELAGEATLDQRLAGAAFRVAASDALFGVVVYDQRYFDQIEGFTGTPQEFLDQTYSRPNQVFTPRNPANPDGPGSFQNFRRGFDQMMGVRQLFRIFPGFSAAADGGEDWCEAVAAHAAQVLGMQTGWAAPGTDPAHHGFDFALGLTPDMGGGVYCSWLDVQVGSFIDRDVDRQQVILVHETGHMFGAPHCDDVGDGEGGPLQGYVMCSGEKHANYPGQFVWHATSRAAMYNRWD